MQLNTTEELIADIRAGKMVILMDDEDRENEGDIINRMHPVLALNLLYPLKRQQASLPAFLQRIVQEQYKLQPLRMRGLKI